MPVDIPSTRPLIDKLGVKDGMRISVLQVGASGFLATLRTRTRDISLNQPQEGSDLIFLGAVSRQDLMRIEALAGFIQPNGAIWVVYPKGVQTIKESHVREAGLAAGLVDNKVVSFSATQTGLRFVIPLRLRKTADPKS